MKLPHAPPPLAKLLRELGPAEIEHLFGRGPLVRGRYLHWDEVRHGTPPEGVSQEACWVGIKLARGSLLKDLPLTDKHGRPMWVGAPDPVLRGAARHRSSGRRHGGHGKPHRLG